MLPAPVCGTAPPCWACQHYRRVEPHGSAYHWCELSRDEFPNIGRNCAAYLYEPGSDRREFRGDR